MERRKRTSFRVGQMFRWKKNVKGKPRAGRKREKEKRAPNRRPSLIRVRFKLLVLYFGFQGTLCSPTTPSLSFARINITRKKRSSRRYSRLKSFPSWKPARKGKGTSQDGIDPVCLYIERSLEKTSWKIILDTSEGVKINSELFQVFSRENCRLGLTVTEKYTNVKQLIWII